MRIFGYVNGKPVQLDSDQPVEIVLSRPQDDDQLHRWGGHTLARLRIEDTQKYTHAWLSARVSGDMRAGSQRGVHLEIRAAKASSDVAKEIHVSPVFPLSNLSSRMGDE